MITFSLMIDEAYALEPIVTDRPPPEHLRPYLVAINLIDTKVLANNKMMYGTLCITRKDIETQATIYDVLRLIRLKCNRLERQLKELEYEAKNDGIERREDQRPGGNEIDSG